jgi:hypothetical protein
MPALRADQANVRANPHDGPVKVPARVGLAEANHVADFEINGHDD